MKEHRQKFLKAFPGARIDERFSDIHVSSLEWARFITDLTSHLGDDDKDRFMKKIILENNFEDLTFNDLERLIHEMD